jgi:hypothetical protein
VAPGTAFTCFTSTKVRILTRCTHKTRHKRALLVHEASDYLAKACKAYDAPGGEGGGFFKAIMTKIAPLSVDNTALNLWLRRLYDE